MSQQNVTAIIFQRDFFSKFKNKDELINLGLKQAPQEVRYLLERIQDERENHFTQLVQAI